MTAITLFNPGFETGVHTDARQIVICTQSTASVSADSGTTYGGSHTGTYSAKWNPNVSQGIDYAEVVPKTAGQATPHITSERGTHTFSVWLKTNLQQGEHIVTLRLRAYDASDALLAEESLTLPGTVPLQPATWTEHTITQDPVTDTAYIQPVVEITCVTDLNGGSFYVDDLSLDVVPEAPPAPPPAPRMRNIDVLRLEVEQPTVGLPNLVNNPNGELGAWGWLTPVANTQMSADGESLEFTTFVSQHAHFKTELMPVVAGKYVSGRYDVLNIISGGVKTRFEFYDSARTLITSSPENPFVSADGTHYVATYQAPAGTEYVSLRFDLYGGSANTVPFTNQQIQFNKAMVTYTDTSTGMGSIRENLITEPNGDVVNIWEENANTNGEPASSSLIGGHTGANAIMMLTAPGSFSSVSIRTPKGLNGIPVVGGETYALQGWIAQQYDTADSKYANVGIMWFDSTGFYLGEKDVSYVYTTTTWAKSSGIVTAPTNAAYASVYFTVGNPGSGLRYFLDDVMLERASTVKDYFDGSTTDTATVTYTWTGVADQSTSTATVAAAAFDYTESEVWKDILGPTHEIKISREAFDVGLLTATVLDANLDPATADTIRPGRGVRLRALVEDVWTTIYRGTLNNAVVNYDKPKFGETVSPAELMATNYFYDPFFDYGTLMSQTNWTLSQDTSFTFGSRSQSLKVVSAGSGQVNPSTNVGTLPPGTYTMSAWFYNPSSNPHGVSLRAGGVGVDEPKQSPTVETRDEWTQITHTFTITSGTFSFFLYSSNATGDTTWWSDVSLTEGTEPLPIFSGDTTHPGFTYAWSGTPGQSWSTKTKNATPVRPVNTRIDLTASDAIADLANQGEGHGVASIADLPYVLEGKGVPWNVNGLGNQITSADIVSFNPNMSVLDQIAVTRDSNLGYAWLDRTGVLQAWDNDQINTLSVATFSDAAYPGWLSYTDIDVDFNTDDCINQVQVKWLRYDIGSDSTQEITYPLNGGYYTNAASVNEWGARAATFTIQGHPEAETEANIVAFADAVLAANATPVVKARTLTTPVRNTDELAIAAVLDLYDPVGVKYSNKVDATLRISGIEHVITPSLWQVNLAFESQTTVAPPTFVPSPPFNGLAAGTSQAGFITMYAGATPPTGWLLCNGSTFSQSQYPELASIVGDTFGTHVGDTYYLPDLRRRFPFGDGVDVALGGNDGLAEADRTASHSHSASGLSTGQSVNTGDQRDSGAAGTGIPRWDTFDTHTHNVTGSTGSWSGFPYLTLNFIIKV